MPILALLATPALVAWAAFSGYATGAGLAHMLEDRNQAQEGGAPWWWWGLVLFLTVGVAGVAMVVVPTVIRASVAVFALTWATVDRTARRWLR